MEDSIVEINQKVNEMWVGEEDEVEKIKKMVDDLPPIDSIRDFLRGHGFDPDVVLNPDNQSNVGDDEALKEESDSLEIQRSKREQLLKRFVRDNLKQLLCDVKNKPKPTLETVVRNQIERTLEYFKDEMKGGDYEYVSCDKMIPTSIFVTHTNFYARRKGSDSPPELFFAVLENGCPHEATHCCKLDHDVNGTLQRDEVVRHCEHVKCLSCARWSGYVIRSGEDVIM